MYLPLNTINNETSPQSMLHQSPMTPSTNDGLTGGWTHVPPGAWQQAPSAVLALGLGPDNPPDRIH